MTKQQKMIIFIASGGLVVVILGVLLFLTLNSNKKSKQTANKTTVTSSLILETSGSNTATSESTDESDSTEASNTDGSGNVTSKVNPTQGSANNKTNNNATTTTKPADNSRTRSLLSDPKFENGFTVKGLLSSENKVEGYFPRNALDHGGRVYWNIAQWAAGYSLVDAKVSTEKKLSEGVYQVENPTMKFIANTNTSELTFNVKGSVRYPVPRNHGEGWLHLLIETGMYSANNWSKVSEMESVIISMDTKLTKFEDHMGTQFDSSRHAAQFLMYLPVVNTNTESKDHGKYIWFGMGMFDNREEFGAGGAMLDKGTGSMMFSVATKDSLVGNYHYFKNGKVVAGANTPWVSYKLEVINHVRNALKQVQAQGFLPNTKYEDLSFGTMNLGWELPGTYDAEMVMKNFNIMATKKK